MPPVAAPVRRSKPLPAREPVLDRERETEPARAALAHDVRIAARREDEARQDERGLGERGVLHERAVGPLL